METKCFVVYWLFMPSWFDLATPTLLLFCFVFFIVVHKLSIRQIAHIDQHHSNQTKGLNLDISPFSQCVINAAYHDTIVKVN